MRTHKSIRNGEREGEIFERCFGSEERKINDISGERDESV